MSPIMLSDVLWPHYGYTYISGVPNLVLEAPDRHIEHFVWNFVQLFAQFCDAVKQYLA